MNGWVDWPTLVPFGTFAKAAIGKGHLTLTFAWIELIDVVVDVVSQAITHDKVEQLIVSQFVYELFTFVCIDS